MTISWICLLCVYNELRGLGRIKFILFGDLKSENRALVGFLLSKGWIESIPSCPDFWWFLMSLVGVWLYKRVSLHNQPLSSPGFPLCLSGFLSLIRAFIQTKVISYVISSHLQWALSHRRSHSEFLKLMPVHGLLGDTDALRSNLSVFSLSLAAG